MKTSREARVIGLTVLVALALWFALRPGKDLPVAGKTGSTPVPAAVSPGVAGGNYPSLASATPGAPSTAAVPKPPVVVIAAPVYAPGVSVSPDESPATAVAGVAATGPRDARTDVGRVRVMMRDYHTLAGENPVGTNVEIMSAIMGGNARQATLGPPEGITLNGKGELIDQWNTPYFFHQLSKDVMEIRSAGPDKVLWTQDDIVAK